MNEQNTSGARSALKRILAAILALAMAFLVSCGEHSFELGNNLRDDGSSSSNGESSSSNDGGDEDDDEDDEIDYEDEEEIDEEDYEEYDDEYGE